MQKMKLFILLAVAVIVIVACSPQKTGNSLDEESSNDNEENLTAVDDETNDEDINKEIDHESGVEENDKQSSVDSSMLDFLLPEGSKAHFKGEGNEFAELDIEVIVANDTYAIVDEDNGGALVRTIYSIQQDRIEIISKEAIDIDVAIPTPKELTEMEPVEVYLQSPFEKGNTFGDWTIVDTSATVETPYKKFKNAIVIEMTDKDFVNRKYFVQGYGEVKRESIMDTEENEEFIITSILESVE